MRSIVSSQFRKMLEKLPAQVQEEARTCFDKWREDPAKVGWKRIQMMRADIFSTQIGQRYRAIGVVSKEHGAVVWTFVGSHEDYNNFITIRRTMSHDSWVASEKHRLVKPEPSRINVVSFKEGAAQLSVSQPTPAKPPYSHKR